MTLTQVLLLLLIGLMGGTISGALGVGGMIIIVPSLVFFMGLTQHQAQGTSLAMMLLPIGFLGVMNYYKAGHIKVSYALIMMAAFIIGSYLGSKFAVQIPAKSLKQIFGVLLILIGFKMALGK
jgi:uncharacterized membrane protein YfcA